MALQRFERDVNAVLLQIDRHILPEIGQLKRGAGGVGEPDALGIGVSAQAQHQPADRVGRIAAVGEQVLVGRIARHGLVLHEGADQIGERLLRNLMPVDRAAQSDEHRMAGAPGVHLIQLLAPPGQQAQALLLVADLIAQVVGPAAEGVHVIEILVQALGQQKADDVEVLVVMGGQPARVSFRVGDVVAGGHGLRRAHEVRWGQVVHGRWAHGMMAVLR